MSELPFTERELIQQCQREYETAAAHGGQEALDACFRCGWRCEIQRNSSSLLVGMVDLIAAVWCGVSWPAIRSCRPGPGPAASIAALSGLPARLTFLA